MAKELRIDGTLRNSTAVDGEIFFASTRRVIMDDSGQDVLTHTALANNQHTQIDGRDLKGHVQRVIQSLAITYDIVTLFDVLKFSCLH